MFVKLKMNPDGGFTLSHAAELEAVEVTKIEGTPGPDKELRYYIETYAPPRDEWRTMAAVTYPYGARSLEAAESTLTGLYLCGLQNPARIRPVYISR